MLREVLKAAVSAGASDIHIKSNHAPGFRISGTLSAAPGFDPIPVAHIRNIVKEITPPHLIKIYEQEHEVDFSHAEPDVGRFRVNIFDAQGAPVMAMRHVKDSIPTFEQLRLPDTLHKIIEARHGIVLLAGTTGSGKSTTLAAMIGTINRTRPCRIITIEDPVEYMFHDDKAMITQREVGIDTISFVNSLKHMMRQDPDVILIGEMRDAVSIRTAFLAAETGHMVFSTLHAGTADLAVPRIINVFPANERDNVRMALAANLHAVICQRLIPDVDGGVIPAVEILINTPTVTKLLTQDRLNHLATAIQTGREDGMQSFNHSVYDHIINGRITETEGLKVAGNPEALRMNLQGIFLDEDSRIIGE
ncbi:MAG: type IV pilus twitching motility protein PilT [Kiritimatiellia bacterium]